MMYTTACPDIVWLCAVVFPEVRVAAERLEAAALLPLRPMFEAAALEPPRPMLLLAPVTIVCDC
jgi:hypothetical protein